MSRRTASSRRWLDRHVNDPYVQRAQREGWRSRAAFKLLELQEKDRILAPGMRVVDLGAAPGGWSQVAGRLVRPGGQVIALDLLPIEPLDGVLILEGDFREPEPLARLEAALEGQPLDLVLSDMAPNLSGVAVVDQTRAMHLAELTLELADTRLRPGGAAVIKVFHGAGFDAFLRNVRQRFRRVASRKPQASRPESRELYLVARDFHP